MQNSFRVWFLIVVAIGLSSVLIRCNLSTIFSSNETFIPRYEIAKDINALQQIRLIQLLNWPLIKKKLHEDYPMIDSIKLSWHKFPNINILIKEKKPWVMIINKNQPYIFSYDGILLNKNLNDVELPNQKIMIVNSSISLIQNNQINPQELIKLQQISAQLEAIPLFKIQQILLKKDSIQILEESGLTIQLGNEKNLKEKFLMLKYFIGENRKKLNQMQFIDIQFPKRVIIK